MMFWNHRWNAQTIGIVLSDLNKTLLGCPDVTASNSEHWSNKSPSTTTHSGLPAESEAWRGDTGSAYARTSRVRLPGKANNRLRHDSAQRWRMWTGLSATACTAVNHPPQFSRRTARLSCTTGLVSFLGNLQRRRFVTPSSVGSFVELAFVR